MPVVRCATLWLGTEVQRDGVLFGILRIGLVLCHGRHLENLHVSRRHPKNLYHAFESANVKTVLISRVSADGFAIEMNVIPCVTLYVIDN